MPVLSEGKRLSCWCPVALYVYSNQDSDREGSGVLLTVGCIVISWASNALYPHQEIL